MPRFADIAKDIAKPAGLTESHICSADMSFI
jgi:hypothetical protein